METLKSWNSSVEKLTIFSQIWIFFLNFFFFWYSLSTKKPTRMKWKVTMWVLVWTRGCSMPWKSAVWQAMWVPFNHSCMVVASSSFSFSRIKLIENFRSYCTGDLADRYVEKRGNSGNPFVLFYSSLCGRS